MKKAILALAALLLVTFLAGCGSRTCHYCGKKIQGDAVTGNGRYYCSYDHYMSEAFGL